MLSVDLNCDLGESYGRYKIGNDEKVLEHISSANIACGYHAGDHNIMAATVKLAKEFGVQVGAHPGFPDLHGFGRREMRMDLQEVYNLTVYQIGALEAIARTNGTKLVHVKPHGALYNMAANDMRMAESIARAVYDADPGLILFGLAGSMLVQAGEARGLKVAHEVFADRNYEPDGTLTPRSRENAMIHNPDEVIKRVLRMVKEQKVTAVDGTDISIKADTICVHGDEPQALEFVEKLKHVLRNEGISIRKSWDRK